MSYLVQTGDKVLYLACDVSDRGQVMAAAKEVVAAVGHP